MKQAKADDTVKVHYNGTLDDGSVFDSSEGRDPLEFKVGAGMVIPGFENAIVGLEEGKSTKVVIPSAEAYGPYREDLVGKVERSQLPPELNPEPGMMLQASSPEEGAPPMTVTIKGFDDTTVTLDANHALAGQQLSFDITLVEIVSAA